MLFDTNINGNRAYQWALATDYPAGTWHHLVGAFESRKFFRFYVNGERVMSYDFPGYAWVSGTLDDSRSGSFFMGEDGDYGHFEGMLDELAIYNRVLTEEEVEAHYRMGKP